ncbi:MAG: cobalt transporter CbiM [Deltaproteobacteria bacterium]|nr:cobalt transporter CbiM [Deltaproteobacteria bacterium]MBW1930323.1 cobalt transporter CbiM [Deltaproteobacteria bacterium]MBW2025289.1 cobalt transporter CbiM [Deltaproteobacteria bacterium]MBW2125272.1 cobalt transporter CbiM [Deltaproteobacteria bacterium]RLB17741.1 MAG: cobalt transporter CbiM [Deltaproteobacteria bacterium]
MHISEGVLSAQVLIAGGAIAAAGTAIGIKKMDYDKVPEVAVFASAFFVASLIHVPIGPSSVHLILNGLMGLVLGWTAFPAILIALLLQAVLFQFGGLTTLGVNTVTMAVPAIVCYLLFHRLALSKKQWLSITGSFACGAGAVFMGAVLVATALVTTGEAFAPAAKLILLAHLPVMAIEGIITVLCVKFLRRVKPEILEATYAR